MGVYVSRSYVDVRRSAINTACASDEELSVLADACSVAPFGRGAEAVVDDSYRKAGKLDLPHFAIPFDPVNTALASGIKVSVLEGQASNRPIRFELYKVNVYGTSHGPLDAGKL